MVARMNTLKRIRTAFDILLARPRWVKRTPRERFLLPHEWEALRPVLSRSFLKRRVFFSILLLEGPRRDEARLMQRAHVDLTQGIWHKPTTKNGRRQILALSATSCTLLAELPNVGPYFFVGAESHLPWSATAVEHAWRSIRKEAGCTDVQIRDLRRTCATWMVAGGENLMVIKEVLHHSSVATTQIYARADQTTVRAALTRHADRVFAVPQLEEGLFP